MKKIFILAAFSAVGALSGCQNAGDQLAFESSQVAQCILKDGTSCKDKAPAGATVERASVAAKDDAVRVSGAVSSEDECLSYASNAKAQRPDYIVQAVINDTVVRPYGDIAIASAAKAACSAPPYRVSLTMAKAP